MKSLMAIFLIVQVGLLTSCGVLKERAEKEQAARQRAAELAPSKRSCQAE
jgi:hypothetical protein